LTPMKADRGIWRSAYSIYEGALQRLGTMEPPQVWEWFFAAAEKALEQHDHATLLTDMIIAIHSEIEKQIEGDELNNGMVSRSACKP